MSRECDFLADALVERAAGTLEPDRAGRVEAHVAACDDCRASLDVLSALMAARVEVPAGLEARVQAAVREGLAPAGAPAGIGGRWRWRSWAVPLATAAALAALWFGVGLPDRPAGDLFDAAAAVFQEYSPYGSWPGSEGAVAGGLVLGDLTVEELEVLLREME